MLIFILQGLLYVKVGDRNQFFLNNLRFQFNFFMHSYIKIIIPILSYFTLSTQYRTYNILLFPSDSFLILLPFTFKRLIIILFYCFMQQPDMKGEITIGSPRNITLNTLNGNQFFTLDYEGKEAFSKTVLMENYYIQMRNKQKYSLKTGNFAIKNPIRSAQFSRSTHNNFYQPFSRIKKVDAIIKQKKQLQQGTKHQYPQTQRVIVKFPKAIKRQKEVISEETKYRSFLMDPINKEQQPKREIKTLNNFQQNYKNRRKLADRSFKKSPRHYSPVLLSKQESEKTREKQRNWSPLDTKFMISHLENKSIEGNKIKFDVHQKVKKRYNN